MLREGVAIAGRIEYPRTEHNSIRWMRLEIQPTAESGTWLVDRVKAYHDNLVDQLERRHEFSVVEVNESSFISQRRAEIRANTLSVISQK